LFENLVYSELRKKGFEIFYYSNKNECDFILKRGGKITALQAAFELNEHNLKREINGVKEAMKDLNTIDGLIITNDMEDVIDGIPVYPFFKYFESKF